MSGLEILSLTTAALATLGAMETVVHRRKLRRIPIRIHVSGTRGKSSVTRLIAAALRHAQIPTVAKTTGTLARCILPDGRELPIFRPAGPNIIEQIRIVDAAVDLGAVVLVTECMALQPWLHWLSEARLVRSTHGVITNVRADHLDVMGPTEEDVADTLAGMIPVGGTLFTAERRHLTRLAAAAKDRQTRLVTLSDEALFDVSDTELRAFRYVEHRENVALALRVLAELDVPRSVAMAGMQLTPPDPGALTEHLLDFFGRQIRFVNAFAANDPESTARIWNMVHARHAQIDYTVAVFNLRADRPARTLQLAEASYWRGAARVVLMGTGAYVFARHAEKMGVDATRLVYAENADVPAIFETIVGLCRRRSLVIGMANMGGQGLELVRYFANRAHPTEDA